MYRLRHGAWLFAGVERVGNGRIKRVTLDATGVMSGDRRLWTDAELTHVRHLKSELAIAGMEFVLEHRIADRDTEEWEVVS